MNQPIFLNKTPEDAAILARIGIERAVGYVMADRRDAAVMGRAQTYVVRYLSQFPPKMPGEFHIIDVR